MTGLCFPRSFLTYNSNTAATPGPSLWCAPTGAGFCMANPESSPPKAIFLIGLSCLYLFPLRLQHPAQLTTNFSVALLSPSISFFLCLLHLFYNIFISRNVLVPQICVFHLHFLLGSSSNQRNMTCLLTCHPEVETRRWNLRKKTKDWLSKYISLAGSESVPGVVIRHFQKS